MIEHEAEELRDCDRIVVMREGEIVADDAPAEVMTRIDLLEQCGVHPPDLNRIMQALGIATHVRSVEEAEEAIRRTLPYRESAGVSPTAQGEDSGASAAMVQVQDLSFSYPFGPPVLNGVDLEIAAANSSRLSGRTGRARPRWRNRSSAC